EWVLDSVLSTAYALLVASHPFEGLRQELLDRQGAAVLPRALVNGDRPGLGFLVADHEHVRDLLELGIANLGLHPLAASVDLDAQVGRAQPGGNLLRVG